MILVRAPRKVKVQATFRGQFRSHFDPPTQSASAEQLRGWVGIDGTLAKRTFRFVTTHLEAYSPDIADKQMQQLLERRRPLALEEAPVDPRRRLQLRAVVATPTTAAPSATPARTTRRSTRASATAAEAQRRAASPRTCTRRDKLETWIDHVLVRPKIKALKSGIVGTKQVGGLYPSDHAGITATLRLKK